MKANAYIVTGPTASGKSDFAHKLAKAVNGVVINCDSVQIYRGIENISASPFAGRELTDSIDGVPYRLFSVLPLSEQISVVDYLNLARSEYDKAIANGLIPVFVGGTGMYVNALLNGVSPMPKISPENRKRARDLVDFDICSARALLPDDFLYSDKQRVARAVEVFYETGRHLTEFQREARIGAVLGDACKILVRPSIDVLRTRIAERVPKMLAGGAYDEAQLILNSGWDENRAIGAAQLCKLVRGEVSQSECVESWVTKTNQYAKRQATWFRTQFNPDISIMHVPTDLDIVQILK